MIVKKIMVEKGENTGNHVFFFFKAFLFWALFWDCMVKVQDTMAPK